MAGRVSVIALSSVPVAGLVARRAESAWTLTVVCRTTLSLHPGVATLAPIQQLPVAGDRGYPDGITPGLYAPSDLVPMKSRVDVMVVGRAAKYGTARLAIADIDARADIDPSRAPPFGPQANLTTRALLDDERLLLENLHPVHPMLETRLPGLRPIAVVEGRDCRLKPLALRADTLWIEASLGVCAVVWRGQLALDRDLPLRVLVDVEVTVPPPPKWFAPIPPPIAVASPPPPVVPIVEVAAPAAVQPISREVLDLVWIDPNGPPRIRRIPSFRAILDAFDDRPPSPHDPFTDIVDLADREDRRDLFEILVRGEPLDGDALASALEGAVLADGRLIHPIVLVAGNLSLVFDKIESLGATVSAATPHVETRPAAKTAIELALGYLAAPYDGRGTGLAASLSERIRAAFAAPAAAGNHRAIAIAELDADVKRGLVDGALYERRELLGAKHVRGLFEADAPSDAPRCQVPTYLPKALADRLPREENMRVRMLTVVRPALDRGESVPLALHPLALAIATRRTPDQR